MECSMMEWNFIYSNNHLQFKDFLLFRNYISKNLKYSRLEICSTPLHIESDNTVLKKNYLSAIEKEKKSWTYCCSLITDQLLNTFISEAHQSRETQYKNIFSLD